MPVPHTPHASTETKKVGGQIFLPHADADPPAHGAQVSPFGPSS